MSIDPNYLKFKLGKITLKPNLTLEKLIKYYDKNDIDWRFIPREFDKEIEIEIVTIEPKISVIFSFNKNYVRMSKFQLQQ